MRPERPPAYSQAQNLLFFIVIVLSVLGCSVRPSPRRWLLFIPLLFASLFFVFCVKTDDMISDYAQINWIATNIFIMSDFLVFTDVQNVLRKNGQHTPIASSPFLKRLQWGFDLYVSNRGVGWQHEPTAYLPRQGKSAKTRLAFVVGKLVALSQCCLLYVAGDVAMQMNSSFRTHGPAFDSQVWWLRPTVLGHSLAARAAIDAMYTICSIVSVSLGLSTPDSWPPLFGSFLDAYSVHNLWRRVWHQLMRRFLLVHGTFVADIINPSSKILRALIKLYVGFSITAVIHYISDISLLQNLSSGGLKFFMIQAVAITFEHLFSVLIQKAGIRVPKWIARAIGYIWVLCWFTRTLPIWIEPLIRASYLEDGWHSPIVVLTGEWLRDQLGIYH